MEKTTRPTIKDIARILDISPSTVSYAINGGPRPVNPETREKVLALVRQLDYHPNANARNLITKKTNTCGVVFPKAHGPLLDNPFIASVMGGIIDCAEEIGYDILLLHVPLNSVEAEAAVRHVLGGRVDGLLFIAPRPESPILKGMSDRELPFVTINSVYPAENASAITINNDSGVDAIVEYLLSLGHRKIGFLSGDPNLPDARVREERFMELMLQADCHVLPHWIQCGNFAKSDGYEATKRLLQSGERPTAIFCSNDLMALGALEAAAEMGIRVPEELSIAGFDDIPAAAWTTPPLTTVRQPMYEMGKQALQMLVEQIDQEALPKKVTCKVELVIRGSCCPVR